MTCTSTAKAPQVAARLRGDYRSGKRLNMRRVIPYIASGFRKDKIWLRRTKPSKRQYEILVGIDDSATMRENGAGAGALAALATLAAMRVLPSRAFPPVSVSRPQTLS